MAMITTHKLCWNCEGDVETEMMRCPYCGVDLGSHQAETGHSPNYTPPYRLVNAQEQQAPPPPYSTAKSSEQGKALPMQEFHPKESSPDSLPQTPRQHQLPKNGAKSAKSVDSYDAELKSVLIPLGTLLSGFVFLIFGLALSLFAKDGVFTLRWSADYASLYLIMAAPLLFFGWKALQKIE